MLQIYNTLLRRKETFKPINPGHASIYVCGMTVYDFCHIGHARVLVVFDMVTRWLRASGFEVNYVRNITDIDDKIIKRAIENNETIGSLTNRFIKAMHEDADALGVLPPNFEPRATQYIDAMQGMIGRLIEKNIAYQADSGDVNFSVREFPGYGKLSGKSLDDLEGDRVIIVGDKKDPLDFVMWKSAKTDEPEDTRWNSPWGEGRPGWHIECSAMSCELLGYHFDIHGGGADLQFPHHENEIAQSEGVHRNFNDEGESSDPQYVNYWMHNGHVRVNNEKMAKSLGNFFIIRDVLKKFDPEVIRFFILRAHYRSPVNYSDATLEEAKQGLERLYNSLSGVAFVQNLEQTLSNEVALQSSTWYVRFKEAMDDDFNTSEAIAVLFELSTEINRSKATHQVDEQLVLQLRYLGAQLGLLQRPVQEFLQGEILGISVKEIEDFIQERILAKKNKDFVMADKIRKDLLVLGVILEDQPGGITVWRKE
ncbi:MAG: cysteine--tRNA ligase [Betaproteobacteria bacterium]|jgi:cysteinyl-tRNA synthetase